MIWIIIAVVVVLALVVVVLYNKLVRLRNRTENAWAQVDVQLRRRYDLIPNLVEAVKGYAAHERETFEAVTEARTAAQQAQGVEQQAQAENVLTAAIGRLFAVAEAYPELRATENFQQLQTELSETETKIAVSRQVYNDTVLTYDNALQTVPTNMIAGIFGFDSRPYFEIEEPAAAARGSSARRQSEPEPARLAWRSPRSPSWSLAALVAAPRPRSRSRCPQASVDVAVAADGSLRIASTSPSPSTGRSPAPTATSRCARASRSTRSPSPRTAARTGPAPRPSSGATARPGQFGVARTDDGVRIVWHYRALSERRTFTVAYRFRGLAVAYDDVVDVNLKVWGDEWKVGARQRLEATMTLPGVATGPRYRVWGHPYWVHGDVARLPRKAVLRALDIPAGPVRRAARRLPAPRC